MTNRFLRYTVAGALSAMLAFASPAFAFHGGGGMGGGHMGGGMHFGAMGGGTHFGGMGGGAHFGGMGGPGRFAGAGFAAPRSSFAAVGRPGFSHFGRPGFSPAFAPRFNRFAFHDRRFFFHHHRRFAFFGAPFLFASAGWDSCWRRVWTPYGPRWVDVCSGYSDWGY